MRRSDYDSVTPVISESNNVHGTFQELYFVANTNRICKSFSPSRLPFGDVCLATLQMLIEPWHDFDEVAWAVPVIELLGKNAVPCITAGAT